MAKSNNHLPEELFDISCPYREYVMASTILSAKFVYLLQIVENTLRYNSYVHELAAKVRCNSNNYKRSILKTASADTGLPLDILLHCSAFYSKIDLQISAASIEKKISIWNNCMIKAMESKKQMPNNFILAPAIPLAKKELLVELDDEQIVSELLDYADEIQAWLDIHFADEYDEYSDDEKFMDIVCIMVDLEFMANCIKETPLYLGNQERCFKLD